MNAKQDRRVVLSILTLVYAGALAGLLIRFDFIGWLVRTTGLPGQFLLLVLMLSGIVYLCDRAFLRETLRNAP